MIFFRLIHIYQVGYLDSIQASSIKLALAPLAGGAGHDCAKRAATFRTNQPWHLAGLQARRGNEAINHHVRHFILMLTAQTTVVVGNLQVQSQHLALEVA